MFGPVLYFVQVDIILDVRALTHIRVDAMCLGVNGPSFIFPSHTGSEV